MALSADFPHSLTHHHKAPALQRPRQPLLGACGCGPGCSCGCQSGGPCQCGGSC